MMAHPAATIDRYRACARNAFDDRTMCAFIERRTRAYREAKGLFRSCANADVPKTAHPERKRARPEPESEPEPEPEPMEQEPQRPLLNVTVLPPYRALPVFSYPPAEWHA